MISKTSEYFANRKTKQNIYWKIRKTNSEHFCKIRKQQYFFTKTEKQKRKDSCKIRKAIAEHFYEKERQLSECFANKIK